MANHAYIHSCKKQLTIESLRSSLQQFCDDHLEGLFEVRDFSYLDGEKGCEIVTTGKTGEEIMCLFWLSEFTEVDECEDPIKTSPAIEHRHGHRYHFEWWLCFEVMCHLARHFEGEVYDDGIGPCHDENRPLPSKFRPFDPSGSTRVMMNLDVEQMKGEFDEILETFFKKEMKK